MTKALSFYVAYTSNELLRDYLNALKVVADDSQRTEAHITVRGPYSRRLPADLVMHYNDEISQQILVVDRVGNFFDEDNQNTVFFSCRDNTVLKSVWKKFAYKKFNPHITIYDGDDRDYAVKIFETLRENFKPFEYPISSLTYLEPKKAIPLGIFNLKYMLNKKVFRNVLSDINDSWPLLVNSKPGRLELLSKLSQMMHDVIEV